MRRVLSKLDDLLLVVVVAAGGWFGYQQLRPDDRPPAPVEVDAGEAGSPALRQLQALEVKGRAPKTGYDRKRFGVGAIDIDRNGCDYRNDTLRRDLTRVETKPGTNGCKVERGRLVDPYTGDEILFDVADGSNSQVEIDHVVALSDAWQKGAQQLSPEARMRLGNDPRNLLAVSTAANRQKGDGDAATWLPRAAFRCEYVTRQIEVKAAYGLWVTAAERDAMRRVLASC